MAKPKKSIADLEARRSALSVELRSIDEEIKTARAVQLEEATKGFSNEQIAALAMKLKAGPAESLLTKLG